MNRATISIASLTASAAIFATGCENMSPGENAAVFGSLAGVAGGSIARAAGASTGESIAIGAVTGAVVAATVYVIAKHQAPERQRRLAERRARVYYGKLSSNAKPRSKKSKVRYIAVDTEKNGKRRPRQKGRHDLGYAIRSIVGNNVY